MRRQPAHCTAHEGAGSRRSCRTKADGAALRGRPRLRARDVPAATDSPKRLPAQYHGRGRGARPCSGWERVGPLRHNHRERLRGLRRDRCRGKELGRKRGPRCCVAPGRYRGGRPRFRPIRTRPLNVLPRVHFGPIYLVFYQGSSLRRGRRPHLGVGFALRCFQRLSRPDTATQRCPWQDNWYTGGRSTPVLSY